MQEKKRKREAYGVPAAAMFRSDPSGRAKRLGTKADADGVRGSLRDSGDPIVNGSRGLRSLANPSAGVGSDCVPRHFSQSLTLPQNFRRINSRRRFMHRAARNLECMRELNPRNCISMAVPYVARMV